MSRRCLEQRNRKASPRNAVARRLPSDTPAQLPSGSREYVRSCKLRDRLRPQDRPAVTDGSDTTLHAVRKVPLTFSNLLALLGMAHQDMTGAQFQTRSLIVGKLFHGLDGGIVVLALHCAHVLKFLKHLHEPLPSGVREVPTPVREVPHAVTGKGLAEIGGTEYDVEVLDMNLVSGAKEVGLAGVQLVHLKRVAGV